MKKPATDAADNAALAETLPIAALIAAETPESSASLLPVTSEHQPAHGGAFIRQADGSLIPDTEA